MIFDFLKIIELIDDLIQLQKHLTNNDDGTKILLVLNEIEKRLLSIEKQLKK